MNINARLVPDSFVWDKPVVQEPRIVIFVGCDGVVADSVLDQLVSFKAGALSRALTLNEYKVEGVSPLGE
jgi:hypothetical protein